MNRPLAVLACALASAAPSFARAQVPPPPVPPGAESPPLGPPGEAAPGPAPQELPPPPSAEAPPAEPPGAASGPVPDGQWVRTEQYGWVWMPYGDAYTSLPPGGSGEPLEYVYEPSYGWAWVPAPWIWGAGPWPSFGDRGPSRFAWYERGWWRTPSRWRYRAGPEPEGHPMRGPEGEARAGRGVPELEGERRGEAPEGGMRHGRGGEGHEGHEGGLGSGAERGPRAGPGARGQRGEGGERGRGREGR